MIYIYGKVACAKIVRQQIIAVVFRHARKLHTVHSNDSISTAHETKIFVAYLRRRTGETGGEFGCGDDGSSGIMSVVGDAKGLRAAG